MRAKKVYDVALETAVERLKTLEYFLQHAKAALNNEDISHACGLADTMAVRAEWLYNATVELQEAYEELREERASA